MRSKSLALSIAPLIASTLALAAGCVKNDDIQTGAPSSVVTLPPASTASAPPPPPAKSAAATPSALPPSAPKPRQTVEIQIASVANSMMYDKTKLSVPAGSTVHLTLRNTATSQYMQHNWVLVRPGTEAGVALAGLKGGDATGYFDASNEDALAHTPIAKPNETTEVTFKAPGPGDYPYICTFPGHYMMEKGVLTVTP